MISDFFPLVCRLAHYWSYPNTIETAVLVVILYDVIWHRWNAIRDIERDKQGELREVQREEAAEKRLIRRERQEFVRKHWQELQANLILLYQGHKGSHAAKAICGDKQRFSRPDDQTSTSSYDQQIS